MLSKSQELTAVLALSQTKDDEYGGSVSRHMPVVHPPGFARRYIVIVLTQARMARLSRPITLLNLKIRNLF